MDIIGYSYQQQRSFDTLEGAAKNGSAGASPLMGAGMGLGMGLEMGTAVGKGFNGMTQELKLQNESKKKTCPKCKAEIDEIKGFAVYVDMIQKKKRK